MVANKPELIEKWHEDYPLKMPTHQYDNPMFETVSLIYNAYIEEALDALFELQDHKENIVSFFTDPDYTSVSDKLKAYGDIRKKHQKQVDQLIRQYRDEVNHYVPYLSLPDAFMFPTIPLDNDPMEYVKSLCEPESNWNANRDKHHMRFSSVGEYDKWIKLHGLKDGLKEIISYSDEDWANITKFFDKTVNEVIVYIWSKNETTGTNMEMPYYSSVGLTDNTHQFKYKFDPDGTHSANLVVETQTINESNRPEFNYLIPRYAPFFVESLRVTHVDEDGNTIHLVNNEDYMVGGIFAEMSEYTTAGKLVASTIIFDDKLVAGEYTITYQTLGGDYTLDSQAYINALQKFIDDPFLIKWTEIVGKPIIYPLERHQLNITDLMGVGDLISKLESIEITLQTFATVEEVAKRKNILDIYNQEVQDTIARLKEAKKLVTDRLNEFQDRIDFKASEIKRIKDKLQLLENYIKGFKPGMHVLDDDLPELAGKPEGTVYYGDGSYRIGEWVEVVPLPGEIEHSTPVGETVYGGFTMESFLKPTFVDTLLKQPEAVRTFTTSGAVITEVVKHIDRMSSPGMDFDYVEVKTTLGGQDGPTYYVYHPEAVGKSSRSEVKYTNGQWDYIYDEERSNTSGVDTYNTVKRKFTENGNFKWWNPFTQSWDDDMLTGKIYDEEYDEWNLVSKNHTDVYVLKHLFGPKEPYGWHPIWFDDDAGVMRNTYKYLEEYRVELNAYYDIDRPERIVADEILNTYMGNPKVLNVDELELDYNLENGIGYAIAIDKETGDDVIVNWSDSERTWTVDKNPPTVIAYWGKIMPFGDRETVRRTFETMIQFITEEAASATPSLPEVMIIGNYDELPMFTSDTYHGETFIAFDYHLRTERTSGPNDINGYNPMLSNVLYRSEPKTFSNDEYRDSQLAVGRSFEAMRDLDDNGTPILSTVIPEGVTCYSVLFMDDQKYDLTYDRENGYVRTDKQEWTFDRTYPYMSYYTSYSNYTDDLLDHVSYDGTVTPLGWLLNRDDVTEFFSRPLNEQILFDDVRVANDVGSLRTLLADGATARIPLTSNSNRYTALIIKVKQSQDDIGTISFEEPDGTVRLLYTTEWKDPEKYGKISMSYPSNSNLVLGHTNEWVIGRKFCYCSQIQMFKEYDTKSRDMPVCVKYTGGVNNNEHYIVTNNEHGTLMITNRVVKTIGDLRIIDLDQWTVYDNEVADTTFNPSGRIVYEIEEVEE